MNPTAFNPFIALEGGLNERDELATGWGGGGTTDRLEWGTEVEEDDEVDASLRQAFLLALKASEEGGAHTSPADQGRSGRERRHSSSAKATGKAGAFQNLWGETQNRSAPTTKSRGEREKPHAELDSSLSTTETLLREIAWLRRQLHVQQLARTSSDEHAPIDTEMGVARADAPAVSYDGVPETDRPIVVRPGAFRVGGNGDEDDDRPAAAAPRAPRPPSAPGVLRAADAAPLAGQPSDAMLLEANLVVEPETFEAKPIRRRRQLVVVAGLMLLTAIVVAVPLAVILTRPDPPRTPDYDFIDVASLRDNFTKTLPNTTLEAIRLGSNPQARAYHWLFPLSGGTTRLPANEAMDRTTHRFALATLYCATGGNGTWRVTTGWLDSWFGVSCCNGTSDAAARCQTEYGVPTISCRLGNRTSIEGVELSGNGLDGWIPSEIGLLHAASLKSLRLESNRIHGSIPTEVGDLTTLQVLSLFQNILTNGARQASRPRVAPAVPKRPHRHNSCGDHRSLPGLREWAPSL